MQSSNGVTESRAGEDARPQVVSNASTRVRVPSVHEALPFTPFSSIVPFNTEMIPPTLALATSTNDTFSVNESTSRRHILDQLSAGATGAETASRRLQHTLRDVQKLLDTDGLTRYKFQKIPQPSTSSSNGQAGQFQIPELTSFANMVLQTTDIGARYLTPESIVSGTPKTDRTISEAQRPFKHSDMTPSEQRLAPAHVKPIEPGQVTRSSNEIDETLPPRSSQLHSVAISDSLTPAQKAQFQQYPSGELAEYQASPKASHGGAVHVNERLKGEAVTKSLKSLLSDIFDAEETIVSDMSEDAVNDAVQYFITFDSDEGSAAGLSLTCQERLDSAIQKVINSSRLESIPTDDLKHVQRLCDTTVSRASCISLQIEDDWSDADAEEWEQRLQIADSALLGIRTLLRIMIAGRLDKELQSEDFVRTMLEALKNIVETGFVSLVEERASTGEKIRGGASGSLNSKFAIAIARRKTLVALLQRLNRCLRLLTSLLAKVFVDESAISSIVYMCKTLIFAENASTEKDSTIGIQNFEATRKYAMDLLAQVFTKYTDQRQFIFDEILLSLEKLPATKQSARQYRLPDSKPIQLVSALLMRLVQTSATRTITRTSLHDQAGEAEDESSEEENEDSDEEDERDSEDPKATRRNDRTDLGALVAPLNEASQKHASYIMRTLVQRALTTAKNADEPYRKLLDIFTEDFLTVFGSSDWPAAELLLRTELGHMISISENSKGSVPSRNFALEMLGTIGSGILDIQHRARNMAKSLVSDSSSVSRELVELFQQTESGAMDARTLLSFTGPYRIVLEYLHAKGTDDAQLQTAKGYHIVQWSQQFLASREGSADSNASDAERFGDLKIQLRSMIMDTQWLETNHDFQAVSTNEGRFAAMVLTLNSTVCRLLNRLLAILSTSMSSEHPTVKSRSLKSIVTLIEMDPSILERNQSVLRQIFRCAEDASPLVRDSALGLVSKCMTLRPELDVKIYEQIIVRAEDPAVGVRRRALKMLKDIYLRNNSDQIRSKIANAVISRVHDNEESIKDLVRQTIEEIWFQPLYAASNSSEGEVNMKIMYQAQAALLVHTVSLSDDVLDVLQALLTELLRTSRAAVENKQVSKRLIDLLFDGIIDNDDIPGSPSQGSILRALTVFAQASPRLIDASQLERLEPYTKNLATDEDLLIYRLVLTILRHTMPHQSALRKDFLSKLQLALLNTLGKLPKSEINEVAACLWTIDGELKNTEKLVSVLCSALLNIRNMAGRDINDPVTARKLTRLMNLAGQFGNACDFEAHLGIFKTRLASAKSTSVAGIAVEILSTFTSPKQPLAIREASLEAICLVCQRWPKQFLRSDVSSAFDIVLKENNPTLELVLLSGLADFFTSQESSSADNEDPEHGASGRERLARTYVASDHDGAAASLSQRFLSHIVRLAQASYDKLALMATSLMASIVRQGLPHPKECGPSLVALETSPNLAIAQLAFAEHRTMHEKHETIIEKEYMRAMEQALTYQQHIVGDANGYIGQPPGPKLRFFWQVLKSGKPRVRQKYLTNICQKLGFTPSDLDVQAETPSHSVFVRFILGNLALFDYDRLDDLRLLINSLSKTFASSGTSVAQSIESEVYDMTLESLQSSQSQMNGVSHPIQAYSAPSSLRPDRLKALGVSAQILLAIHETRMYLVKVWGCQKFLKRESKASKDSGKAPMRTANATLLTDAYVKRMDELTLPLASSESRTEMCRAFTEVLSIDNEAKIDGANGEDRDDFDGQDDASEGADRKSPSATPGPNTPRGRKRKSVSIGGGGQRRKGRPSLGKKRSSFAKQDEDDDDEEDVGEWE